MSSLPCAQQQVCRKISQLPAALDNLRRIRHSYGLPMKTKTVRCKAKNEQEEIK